MSLQEGTAPFPEDPTQITDDHARCRALGEVLDRVADKWAVMVVGSLSSGPVRFNAMRKTIGGVSQRMLTLTLRGLERDGLVKRTAYATIPPKVEYELTPLGQTLIEPLGALSAWTDRAMPLIHQARLEFETRTNGN